MGEAFPEITMRVSELKEILDEEERSFAKTLDRGEKLFGEVVSRMNTKVMSGSDVWRLYDTYGFPVDLTRLMAEENGLLINEEEFEREQAAAKERSKKKKDLGDKGVALDVHAMGQIEKQSLARPTDDVYKYDSKDITATVKAIYYNNEFVDKVDFVTHGDNFGIILDKTNFYAEQGGQLFDTGSLSIDGQVDFCVDNVQVYGGYVLHIGYFWCLWQRPMPIFVGL